MKSLPLTLSKHRIAFFFQSKSVNGKQLNESPELVVLEPSETIQSSSKPRLGQTLNSNEALFNREAFLNENEKELLKKFFVKIKKTFEQKFLDCFKTFIYELDFVFNELKIQ